MPNIINVHIKLKTVWPGLNWIVYTIFAYVVNGHYMWLNSNPDDGKLTVVYNKHKLCWEPEAFASCFTYRMHTLLLTSRIYSSSKHRNP